MDLSQYFPIWEKLTAAQRGALRGAATLRSAARGTVLHNGSADCVGLFVVRAGQLRAFILSDEGKEITIYRLFERDICLFSASCILSDIQFDVTIEVEKDAEFWVIPADTYRQLMEASAPVANYTNQIMAARFSEVMWLIEQVMWKSFDKRLAAFLLDESALEQSDTLRITHERVAAHMGTAREVVTRMLRYFQSEGLVRLSRGGITLADADRLRALQAG
ncbi:MAG: Crp/Fnr family transcriptional regulator [Eubacteriales bacterium]|nr:Crp/Fnr family transcriptional regulator [Eubacteriales bacterium]